MSAISEFLRIPLSEADGILSFYTLFSRKPRGRYVIRLCDSLSCRICGSLDIYSYLVGTLGIRDGDTDETGVFTLELVNCLGNCDKAPNLMINDTLYTNLTETSIIGIIESLKMNGGTQ